MSTFQQHCQDRAREFIETVLVIDDRLWSADDPAPAHLETPRRGRSRAPEGHRNSDQAELRAVPSPVSMGSSLAHSFANEGLLCSLLQIRGNDSEQTKRNAAELALKADVVVLDWDWSEDENDVGNSAVSLVAAIATSKPAPRLSLVVVRTNRNKPEEVDGIKKRLGEKLGSQAWSDCRLSVGKGTNITVCSKPATISAPCVPVISDEQLPGFAVREFAAVTDGLLASLALRGLTAVRQNSHALLGRFLAPGLDAAFLTHRLFLPEPADAEKHAASLVADELGQLLAESNVGECASAELCCRFLDGRFPSVNPFGGDTALTSDNWMSLLVKGVGDKKKNMKHKFLGTKGNREKAHLCFSELTGHFIDAKGDHDCSLAAMSTLSIPYGANRHTLMLGTVIQELDEGGGFLLCVQAPCDSVRVSGNRTFPFLRLCSATTGSPSFHLVVPLPDDQRHKRLRIKNSFYQGRVIEFQGDLARQLVLTDECGEFTDICEKRYAWRAQLKDTYAQKVMNEFAAHFSRVGVDQSEWLRRQNP